MSSETLAPSWQSPQPLGSRGLNAIRCKLWAFWGFMACLSWLSSMCCGTPLSRLGAAPVWRLPGLGIQKNPLPAAELLDQHIGWTDHFNADRALHRGWCVPRVYIFSDYAARHVCNVYMMSLYAIMKIMYCRLCRLYCLILPSVWNKDGCWMLFTKKPSPAAQRCSAYPACGHQTRPGINSWELIKSRPVANSKIVQPFKISLWLKGRFGSSLPLGRNIENTPNN